MNRTFERNTKVEAAPLNQEAILFNPATSKFYLLNPTSAIIWDRLVSPTTAEALASDLCNSFEDLLPTDALTDVQTALNEMLSMELVIATDSA
jgi:hypothetical protein